MMAARASSTVRSADRPDSTASRRSSGVLRDDVVRARSAIGGRSRLAHQMLTATPARSSAISRA